MILMSGWPEILVSSEGYRGPEGSTAGLIPIPGFHGTDITNRLPNPCLPAAPWTNLLILIQGEFWEALICV